MKTRSVWMTLASLGVAVGLVAVSMAQPSPSPSIPPSLSAALAPASAAGAKPAAPKTPQAPPVLPPVTGEALAHTCAGCHGTQGRLADEAFVPLAGMPAAPFVQTMQAFRSGQRPATLMGHIARGLNDAELQAMAEYFERQTPAAGSAAALNPMRPGAPR